MPVHTLYCVIVLGETCLNFSLTATLRVAVPVQALWGRPRGPRRGRGADKGSLASRAPVSTPSAPGLRLESVPLWWRRSGSLASPPCTRVYFWCWPTVGAWGGRARAHPAAPAPALRFAPTFIHFIHHYRLLWVALIDFSSKSLHTKVHP